jgi:hypothetical protein
MSQTAHAWDDNDCVVAINFCGGCNPVIDRRDIALEIKDALLARGYAVTFNSWDAGFIVRLSGCTADCVSRYHPADPPEAVIAGSTFAATAVDETRLADLAVAAVTAHFGARADDTSDHLAGGSHSRARDQTGPALPGRRAIEEVR